MSRRPRTLLLLLALALSSAHAQSIPPPATEYLTTWAATGHPNDIAANPEDGTLAIVDAGDSSIEILRPGGSLLGSRTGFRDPRAAAFLAGGVLLVGEAGSGSVKGYDPNGRVVLTLGSPQNEFLSPNDIAVHPATGRIYVVDSLADAVKVYAPDGSFEFGFGETGTGPGQFRFPVSVAVSAELDEAFVGDSRNRRIAVFDAATGAFKRELGAPGGDDGEISFVGGLHVDADQRLYVVESLGGFVQMFTPEGGFIGRIGEHGNGPGQLRSPKAVLIDRFNRLLVTSFLDRRIELWGLDAFDNPVDQDLQARASVDPDHVNPNLPDFMMTLELAGVAPGEIDPGSLRLNGSVLPGSRAKLWGPHLSVRFDTTDVLATLPPGTSGPVALAVTGSTREGLRFEGKVQVIIVPPVPEPRTREGGEP